METKIYKVRTGTGTEVSLRVTDHGGGLFAVGGAAWVGTAEEEAVNLLSAQLIERLTLEYRAEQEKLEVSKQNRKNAKTQRAKKEGPSAEEITAAYAAIGMAKGQWYSRPKLLEELQNATQCEPNGDRWPHDKCTSISVMIFRESSTERITTRS